MLTFLFWNLNNRPLEDRVRRLVIRHEVDVLILTECTIPPVTMLRALNTGNEGADYHITDTNCDEVVIYARFSREFTTPMHESGRYTIRAISLPGRDQILLAAAHLPSKLYIGDDGHTLECVRLAEAIRLTERRANHSRTVLVGDFNMNPFEGGITTAMGLHGVMAKEVAKRGARTVQGASYPFFYNPMWGHFGDATKGPPGTYYYERADHKVFFWNIFDHVLLRPSLLDVFENEHLMVLTSDGSDSLLTESGRPDRLAASDHLPILFRLSL
jgi:hypothetical protein